MQSYEINKTTIKRHVISAAVSFITGFSLVMVAEIDKITLESLESGAWAGVVFAAVRAGIKTVLEIAAAKRILK